MLLRSRAENKVFSDRDGFWGTVEKRDRLRSVASEYRYGTALADLRLFLQTRYNQAFSNDLVEIRNSTGRISPVGFRKVGSLGLAGKSQGGWSFCLIAYFQYIMFPIHLSRRSENGI
jgi:hypothetical protein